MKKMRKGFTLVELMIVIGIIGILGAMGLISGQGATSAAKAATILENLNSASSAMMTYYQLNMNDIDINGLKDTAADETAGTAAKSKEAKLAEGANHYLKGAATLKAAATAGTYEAGAYSVAIVGDDGNANRDWYVLYQFVTDSTGDTKVKDILVSKTGGDLIGTLPTTAGGTDGKAFTKDSTYVAIKVR